LARDDDGAEVAKVLDFGIARLSETGDSASHTKSGIVMGTPHYMSPEQALGNTGDKIDARSDIYSLGMVVYQMLCGRVAFQSDSWMQVMYKHISEQPVPPSQLRPGLAYLRQIEPVVLRALEKDREKRQQTTAEFAKEIEAAFEQFKAGGMDATVAADYRSPGLAQNLPFSRTDSTVGSGQPAASPTPYGSPAAANAFSAGKPSEHVVPASSTAAGPRPASPAKRWLLVITALVILIGVGALLVLKPWGSGNRQPAAHRIRRNPMPATHSHSFTALTLDKNGKVVAQHRGETRAFTEDLGGGVGLDMLAIPGGTFEMGASPTEAADHPSELPRHEVTVPAFYMGRFEITEAEWNAVAKLPQVRHALKPDPSPFKGNPKLPVQDVSWYDAEEFCARLSNATSRTYRLPTEAEWEYACRAGTDTPFNTGETITADTVDYDAKYPYGSSPKGTALKQPVPVGSLNAANGFGLTEMHGNMAEWCLDGWHDNYQGAPTDGSEWISGAEPDSRVYRGGSWTSGGDDCRSASRHKYDPDIATSFVGFRVVMVPPKK
ncbi:MAG: SUMF1/EgtB/PvdO family nonheme iron enzyme, partial [Blastocatellia bacterium]